MKPEEPGAPEASPARGEGAFGNAIYWAGQERSGFCLETEVEKVEIHLPATRVPDEDWSYRDGEGHVHAREDGGWPTLIWKKDRELWCERCREPHAEGHYECRECGETVEPGTRPEPAQTRLYPGPISYRLNGEYVTEEEARAAAREAGVAWPGGD